jgi:hypothetical protein
MLVIMLIITPRTFFVGGASGKSGLMGRRGLIGGASGGGSIIGVGTRPWLQKVAALTVAVSLTLATADTFKIAEQQYADGFMDASKLRDQVVSGMEIKVSRVISDVFLWLAQVQTLIRLFPRHKEKVIIKWVGFALILLDITFSCLNSFGPYNDKGRPRHFETAIPALSYLFQLSLSMLYAAWVMYYGITKRRYAFYHSMMWNIAVVALLSFIAVLTPVVFFITDISNYTIAGWGDYFRWVGAAAASVIVWEWVERIEALEREERKDGILGREIYDGDEMLDTTPSHEVWPQRQSYMSNDPKKPKDDGSGRGGAVASGHTNNAFSNLAHRLGRSRKEQPKTEPKNKRTIHIPAPPLAHRRSDSTQRGERKSRSYLPLQSPTTPPPITATPVSRTDTASADSTVYTVRYHPVSDTPPINTLPVPFEERLRAATPNAETADLQARRANVDPEKGIEITGDANMTPGKSRWHWEAVANPFRRRGRSPPPEVQRGRVIEPLAIDDVSANIPPRNYAGLALKDRLGTFAAQQGEKFRTKRNDGQSPERSLPVTIIPAQPRGRTWSPELLQLQQQEEVTDAAGIRITRDSPRSVPDISDGNAPLASQLDAAPEASRFLSSRNSHVRFTPETFQHPAARKHDDADSRAPSQHQSSVSLGTETRDPFSEFTFTPQSPGALPPTVSRQSLDGHHTPTNHNR